MSRGTLDPASCNSDFTYGTFTLSGLTSQTVLLSYCSHVAVRTPERTRSGLGSSVFARRYSQNRCFFLFLRLLRCFSSAGLPTYDYFIHHRLTEYCSAVFPHSDICGSMLICSSPQLFAAYHVLLRLLMPRHSPCALIRLTFLNDLSFSLAILNYVSKLFSVICFIPVTLICISLYIRAFFLKKPDFFLLFSLFNSQTSLQPILMMVEK